VSLPATSYADDLMAARAHGVSTGWSFGFRSVEDIWTIAGGIPRRRVLDMVLAEISPGCAVPAYLATEQASARDSRASHLDARDAHREAALSVARIISRLAADHPEVRLRCVYRGAELPEMRVLDPPRPGWRLRMAHNRLRQVLAETS